MRNTKESTPENSVAQVRAEIDAYMFTIQSMLGLEKIFAETLQIRVRHGPKMDTSAGHEVTPDMSLEVTGGRLAGYRAINEVKSRYPTHEPALRRLARQLQQYDDIRPGWSLPDVRHRPGPPAYDLILTVPADQAADYANNLPGYLRTCGVVITREFCIVGFGLDSSDGDERLHTKKVYGRLSIPDIDRVLAKGDALDMYGLLDELAPIKFYDSNPPIPYTMSILWSRVFLGMIHGKKRRDVRRGRTVKISVTIERLHKLVSKFAPPSNPRCIKTSWVTAALDKFVAVKLARKAKEGEYEIWYRQGESLTLDWLVRLVNNVKDEPSLHKGSGTGASLDPYLHGRDS